jgi:tripartite-type tricarboxylate transporter receptor subunit TctC
MLNSMANALQTIRNAELQRTVDAWGATLVLNSPAEFAAQIKQEDRIWGELAKRYPFD